MKNSFVLLVFVLLFVYDLSSQTSRPKSIVIFNGSKYKSLYVEDTATYLKVVSRLDLSDYYKKLTSSTGQLIEYTDSTLVISSKINYSYEEFSKSLNKYCDSSYYDEYFYRRGYRRTIVKISEIESLSYQSYRAQNWEVGGGLFIFFGSLTSLVIAPLISLDYNGGGFNTTRYLKAVGVGIGMISVGIPLFIFNKEKKYHFKQPKESIVEKLWKIDSFR